MFAKNLKYYRLKKNMSIKALADACGVSSMAISNYERGKRKPEISIINKLAEALDIHVVDLLTSRNTTLSFDHREFRKHSSLTVGQQEYAQEAVEEYFSRFFNAIDCLDDNPLPEPPECYALTISNDFEKDALSLRKHLGLQSFGPIDEIVGMLENKGILVLELDINNDHFSGMNGFVNKYPYIVINKSMRTERKRTTVLHELAHLMFAWDDSDEKQNEKYATAIAGAMLISKNDLIRELGMHKRYITKDMAMVCEEYGISMFLLVKRAAVTGIISPSLEKEFFIRANKVNWKKTEPNRVNTKEEPLLFKQLVFRAVNNMSISMLRGAELLNIPVSEMEEFCGLMEV